MANKESERITSRPYGKVQKVRGKRKLFGKGRQGVFLRRLAATCNVRWSAAAAGVTPECVYQRRARDADFRARWAAAIDEGYAALEAKLLAAAMGGGGDGDDGWRDDAPHPSARPHPPTASRRVPPSPSREDGGEPLDKELALHLLREHKRERGARRESAPALRGASWGEVEGYFIARLRALRVRIDGDGAREGPSGAARCR